MSQGHPNPSDDFCNKDGAEKLKAKIEAYWAERGYEVQVDLRDAGFVSTMRSARADVRSDLVNGLPRRRAIEQKDAA